MKLSDLLQSRGPNKSGGGLTVLNQEFYWHDDNGKGAKDH
jgi:hypothetical protein